MVDKLNCKLEATITIKTINEQEREREQKPMMIRIPQIDDNATCPTGIRNK